MLGSDWDTLTDWLPVWASSLHLLHTLSSIKPQGRTASCCLFGRQCRSDRVYNTLRQSSSLSVENYFLCEWVCVCTCPRTPSPLIEHQRWPAVSCLLKYRRAAVSVTHRYFASLWHWLTSWLPHTLPHCLTPCIFPIWFGLCSLVGRLSCQLTHTHTHSLAWLPQS